MSSDPKYHYILVPGLGFNSQTFRNLELHEAAGYQYVDWLEPESEDEPFGHYVERMLGHVQQDVGHKVLIGHSFGGVIVQELAQRLENVEKVFLVSSIKKPEEMSWNIKMLRSLPLYKLVSHSLINTTFPIWAKLHDFNNPEERDAFSAMVNEMSMDYFKWAVNAIVNWKGIKDRKITPVQIHGDLDRTLYYKKSMNAIVLQGAGHFMIYNRAEEISDIIRRELDASHVPIFDS